VTLTDAGPLIALINRNDPRHASCVAALEELPAEPLVTTWPCFTEAMYLLRKAGGHAAQVELWRWALGGRLVVRDLLPDEIARSSELMAKYHDRPMDLADATLVATAEALRSTVVFTLDSDFQVYRMASGISFQAVPQN
jgi:predicted nucleic acid-binding protein